MIRTQVASIVSAAVASLQADGTLPAVGLPEVDIAEPRDPSHGDFACNFALVASKAAGKNPREIAEKLVAAMDTSGLVASAEVAGPGFLNLRLKPELAAAFVGQVLGLGTEGLASGAAHQGSVAQKRINIEFVSVNPNGPITVGSGRGAAFGSTLANVLQAAGHDVHREYYINDGVNSEQMRQFTDTVRVWVRNYFDWEAGTYSTSSIRDEFFYIIASNVLVSSKIEQSEAGRLYWERLDDTELVRKIWDVLENSSIRPKTLVGTVDIRAIFPDREFPDQERPTWGKAIRLVVPIIREYLVWFNTKAPARVPDNAYRADYVVRDVASVIWRDLKSRNDSWDVLSANEYQQLCQELMVAKQRTDLAAFGVEFDTWFSEQSLHDRGMVERDIADLEAKGAADTRRVRAKLKLGKGGVIEDVELETQAGDVDEDGHAANDAAAANTEDPIHDPRPTTDDPRPTTPDPKSKIENPKSDTLWLRSTKFGDDMDRVLRRQDGRLTYIASDVSYHKDKFNRGSRPGTDGACERADKLITVLGPDHHGYIGRLHAVLAALLEDVNIKVDAVTDLSELEAKLYANVSERAACQAALAEAREKLEVVIFQIVRFVKEGKPAPMRKRDGNIYSLRDLMAEIGKTMAPDAPEDEQMTLGKDVARFFYLMRSHDTHMDFDIDLATKQSDENPVFYCQYAHARICSVLRKAEEAGFGPDAKASASDLARLTHEREIALIKKVCDLSFEVQRCAEDYGVHRLTTYAQDLAKTYHYFYDVCRVIQPEDAELTRARLALCHATAVGLRSVFGLLGISAPERMDRAAQAG